MKTGLTLSILLLAQSSFAHAQSASTFTAVSTMATARLLHTATLLQDGRVLIAGGADASDALVSSAEIYDPVKQTFIPAGNMTAGRASHTATLLPDGRVPADRSSAANELRRVRTALCRARAPNCMIRPPAASHRLEAS